MKIFKHLSIAAVAVMFFSAEAVAQNSMRSFSDNWEIGITGGLNVGATTPLPKPSEVEHIYAWQPHMNLTLKGWATYRIENYDRWGITTGLEVERKGMYASTRVNAIKVHMDKYGFKGERYTGDNSTEIDNYYLTLPVMASYITLNEKFRIHAGLYLSYAMQSSFKVTLDGDGMLDDHKLQEGSLVDFDFSDQMKSMDFGARIGFDFFFTPRIGLTGQVNMAFTSAVKSSFDVMPFSLYNTYGFLGFTYNLFKR